jgi:glycosyltransferase involved in cell wall biosynthesis
VTAAPFGFVSPLPPVRSGIADYAADILPALRAEVELETYEPSGARRAFAAGHRAVLVHVGNDPMHLPTVEALRENARRVPSLLVLHDFSLHHLFAAGYLDRGRVDDYARELERAHGTRGRALGERALSGQRVPVWDLAPWEWPMSTGVAADASRHRPLEDRPRAPSGNAAFPRSRSLSPSHRRPATSGPRPGSPSASRSTASSPRPGIVTPAKRIGKLLEGLALIPPEGRPLLVVGGAVGTGDPLLESVRALGLGDDVRFTGYLSDEDFWRLARAADVAVNLRFPTVGETSAAVCRLAGSGLPVVVSDVGWFRELPDTFASKIPVGEGEVEAIAAALGALTADQALREAQAAAGRAWGRTHTPERIAAAHARLLLLVATGGRRRSGSWAGWRARRRPSGSVGAGASAHGSADPTGSSSERSGRGAPGSSRRRSIRRSRARIGERPGPRVRFRFPGEAGEERPGPGAKVVEGNAEEVRRTVRELLERKGEEAARGAGAPLFEVNAGRRELDQALQVPAPDALGDEPDRLPLLVSLEEASLAEIDVPAGDRPGGERAGNGQPFGRAERIRSISVASTYPSIRFTTVPEPSTKRTTGYPWTS